MLDVLCIVLVAGYVWFYWRVMFPLRRLAAQSQALTRGDFDAFCEDCGGIPEIDALRRAMAGMVSHVRRAQQQTRAYSDGQEAERSRIARELHDDTVQSLIAIAQSLDMALNWSDAAMTETILKSTRQQAIQTAGNLRDLIGDLRPPALDELGLVPALKLYANQQNELAVTMKVIGVQRRLDEAQEITLFRIVQEAVKNAYQHGAATQVAITLSYEKSAVQLTIQDNGTGFDVPDDLAVFAQNQHYGLIGIQERVGHIGGCLTIRSGQEGTTLGVHLPELGEQQPNHVVRDPVCHALIQPEQAYGSLTYEGQQYYFCCPVCKGAFQKEPELYLIKSLADRGTE